MLNKCLNFNIKTLLLLLVSHGWLSLSCVQAQKKENRTAIAFYNVENLFDTISEPKKFDDDFTPSGKYKYTNSIYKKKLQNLADVIALIAADKVSQGPAIIGLAEVENEQVIRDLIAQPKLKNRNYGIVHFESPDARGIDVAMIYRKDLFSILVAKSIPVKLNKERTRDILYVTGVLETDTMHVFVNHWSSRRGGEAASRWKREQAAKICRKEIDNILERQPHAKVIVMGDFNDDPISSSITKTLNTTHHRGKIKQSQLFNPWVIPYRKGDGTLSYNDSWNLFDQIILSYGFIAKKHTSGWKYEDIEIFKRPFMIQQFGRHKGYPHRSFSGSNWIDGYSDHFPTIVYLTK